MPKDSIKDIPAEEMTMQDYVALHIARGMITRATEPGEYKEIAEAAYAAADALCQVRQEREG